MQVHSRAYHKAKTSCLIRYPERVFRVFRHSTLSGNQLLKQRIHTCGSKLTSKILYCLIHYEVQQLVITLQCSLYYIQKKLFGLFPHSC